MGHCERHEPCTCKEREKIKTENGFYLICKYCGHTFKEIRHQKTLTEGLLKEEENE